MAAPDKSSSPDLIKKKVWSHEVAIGELNTLSSSRAVYQKNGNLYFRTSIVKAKAFEEKQLQKLQKQSSHG
ncbi:hypothetical protein DCAR_0101953 [Daucus carota subsp. sativus]|uniref:Uncharacterized protein n=1 Tax=Daucus carota subsp. sativus TaxID=79200 RepID=A0AAF1AJU7_DAUCS|nr:hypothetical protein DCAR_0101953 [Daucus carota subsp. sativus]